LAFKVLLVEQLFEYPVEARTSTPVGLLSMVAYVRRRLPDVDFQFLSLPVAQMQGRLQPLDTLLDQIRPDVVGLGCWTANFDAAVKVARLASRRGITTVFGGIFATMNADWILETYPEVDYIVRGEGEAVFTDLLDALRQRNEALVPGVSARLDGRVAHAPARPLLSGADLPVPAYDIAPMAEYARLDSPPTVFTSRGCAFNCRFCTLTEVWGGYRRRELDEVVGEIVGLVDTYGFGRIVIGDDTFTLERDWALAVCNALGRQGCGARLTVKSRLDTCDAELLEVMAAAGVDEIGFGVEDIDPRSNELLSKGPRRTLRRWRALAREQVSRAAALGYKTRPIFMLAVPSETRDTLAAKVEFLGELADLGVTPFMSFTTPHPGSRLAREAASLGLRVVCRDLARFTHLYPVALPESLGEPEEAMEAILRAYDQIVDITGTREFNPPIGADFFSTLGRPLARPFPGEAAGVGEGGSPLWTMGN